MKTKKVYKLDKNKKIRAVYNALSKRSPDGGVTPHMLLDASREEGTPLHDYFEWNDRKAGEEFRVNQARNFLNSMTVEVDDVRTREFENLVIEVEDQKVQKYYHIKEIMGNTTLKKAVLRQVIKDLVRMTEKYDQYKEIYKILKGTLEVMEKEMDYANI